MCQNDFNNLQPTPPPTQPIGVPTPVFTPFSPPKLTEEQQEKKNIRRTANYIGIAFLVMNAIILVLNFLPLFLLVAVLGYDKAYAFLTEPAVSEAQQILFASFVFTVPFIVIFKIGSYRISDLISFGKPKRNTFLPLFLLGLGVCAFSNLASSYTSQIFESLGFSYDVDFGESPKGFFGAALSFISSVVIAPLVEEFACRGIVLGSLKKYDEKTAILFSAILFGLMHSNFEQMPFVLFIGLILGFITVKSGSIWLAVAIHAANNFIAFAIDTFLSDMGVMQQNILYLFYLMSALFAGIIGILLYTKQGNGITLEQSTTKNTFGARFGAAMSSAPIIIYAVLCVLSSLQYFLI